VVGMGVNAMPKKVRKALAAAGAAQIYLEYGSYLNNWRRRKGTAELRLKGPLNGVKRAG